MLAPFLARMGAQVRLRIVRAGYVPRGAGVIELDVQPAHGGLQRLVSVERQGTTLEVLTTSEKLTHRITAELAKTWRGTAAYKWADDGSLFARWRPGRSA